MILVLLMILSLTLCWYVDETSFRSTSVRGAGSFFHFG